MSILTSNTYHILRGLEILFMYLCGFRILTRTYEWRWNRWWAKIVTYGVYFAWMLIALINTYWFKMATSEYWISTGLTMILTSVFLKKGILQVVTETYFYWYSLLILHLFFHMMSAIMLGYDNSEAYNVAFEEYAILEPIGRLCSVVLVGTILVKRKGRTFLQFHSKGYYIGLLALIIILDRYQRLFFEKASLYHLSKDWSTLGVSAFVLVNIIAYILFFMYYQYGEMKRRKLWSEAQNRLIEEQYMILQDGYREKRKQIHDSKHVKNMLKAYLVQEKYEEAKAFLIESEEVEEAHVLEQFSGISEVDLLLQYKKNIAESYGIRMQIKCDFNQHPLKRNEMCILLGNLLDNAIEATKGLSHEKREITLSIRKTYEMLLICVRNPYEGGRRKIGERYLSTKRNAQEHGIGLESCRQLIQNYRGHFNISDKENIFQVDIGV